jgi:hypothetical protein
VAKPFQHSDWAGRNEQFAESLDLSTSRRKREADHERREWIIQNDPILSEIWQPYRYVKHLSREARYEIAPYSEAEFKKAKQRLQQVKAYILPRIETPKDLIGGSDVFSAQSRPVPDDELLRSKSVHLRR